MPLSNRSCALRAAKQTSMHGCGTHTSPKPSCSLACGCVIEPHLRAARDSLADHGSARMPVMTRRLKQPHTLLYALFLHTYTFPCSVSNAPFYASWPCPLTANHPASSMQCTQPPSATSARTASRADTLITSGNSMHGDNSNIERQKGRSPSPSQSEVLHTCSYSSHAHQNKAV